MRIVICYSYTSCTRACATYSMTFRWQIGSSGFDNTFFFISKKRADVGLFILLTTPTSRKKWIINENVFIRYLQKKHPGKCKNIISSLSNILYSPLYSSLALVLNIEKACSFYYVYGDFPSTLSDSSALSLAHWCSQGSCTNDINSPFANLPPDQT